MAKKKKVIGVFTTTLVNTKIKPIVIGLGTGVAELPAVTGLLQDAVETFRPLLPEVERVVASRLSRIH